MKTVLAVLSVVSLVVGTVAPAMPHGLAGKRFFPATLVVDDPFVADELGFPTVSHIKSPARGEEPATKETELSFEFSKRITRDFGLSLEGELAVLDREHLGTLVGFRNLEVGLKYQWITNAAHEFILSLGAGWEVGGTGRKAVESPSFDAVKPAIFFGKGFGDLPDRLEFLRPFAMTGFVGADIPTRTSTTNTTITFDPDSGEFAVEKEIERHPNLFRWGLVLQYSLPYLQQFVRDVGLPVPLNRIIPLVEVDFQRAFLGSHWPHCSRSARARTPTRSSSAPIRASAARCGASPTKCDSGSPSASKPRTAARKSSTRRGSASPSARLRSTRATTCC